MRVKPKKHLGQHFLNDREVARKIVNALNSTQSVLEIGPGTGVLTQFLVELPDTNLHLIDLDQESIKYLEQHYTKLAGNIHFGDFLKEDSGKWFNQPYSVIGNFPYNISSQILFKVVDERNHIPEVVGMFQKEVAERVAEKPGSKAYGIISVLIQAYYDVTYLFTVDEHVFTPPPKVKSGVIRLVRNDREALPCDEKRFKTVVKVAFNQRRKTLRNSVKSLIPAHVDHTQPLFQQRPEQLSVEDFIELTQLLDSPA